jgi:hypothetical protein
MKDKKDKTKKRIKIYITVDEELYKKFEEKTLEKCFDKALLFDAFIKEWLKNNE